MAEDDLRTVNLFYGMKAMWFPYIKANISNNIALRDVLEEVKLCSTVCSF